MDPQTLVEPPEVLLGGTKLTETSFPLFSFRREGVFVGIGAVTETELNTFPNSLCLFSDDVTHCWPCFPGYGVKM